MGKYLEYIIPVLAFALLTAGWVVVQMIAKKAGTKNHFDHNGNCCGSCEKKDDCTHQNEY